MQDTVLTVEDAATRLPELVERVAAHGEPSVVLKSGRLRAKLVACPPANQAADDLIEFLRRWRCEHPEPDEGWAAAVEEARQAIQPPQDPWE
jgi:antitoxin (DNA-binding transcriptional repressor) of toxin-antitoxin stability system